MSGIAIGWRASDNWEGGGGGGGGRGGGGLPSLHCGGRGGGGLLSSQHGRRGGGGLLSLQHGGKEGAAALSMGEWGILTSSWTGRTPAIEDENGTQLKRGICGKNQITTTTLSYALLMASESSLNPVCLQMRAMSAHFTDDVCSNQ